LLRCRGLGGCDDLRYDPGGHRVCGLELRLVQVVRRRDAAYRGPRQSVRSGIRRAEQEVVVMSDIDTTEVREVISDVDGAPMLEIRNVTKMFGSVISLSDISTTVRAGQVTCVLGDNGAGKSTFIKMLSGVHQPDNGELLMDGKPVRFTTPREALDAGIATV